MKTATTTTVFKDTISPETMAQLRALAEDGGYPDIDSLLQPCIKAYEGTLRQELEQFADIHSEEAAAVVRKTAYTWTNKWSWG